MEENGPEVTRALLQRVLAGGDDEAANELLQAFFRGLPVERLLLLLRSDSEDAVRAGAWIASELGEQAEPLVAEFASLLDHPARYVRFFLVDAVLASATSRDGDAIARAVSKLRDPDEAVRWKALHFLAKASEDQLAAGSDCLADPELRSQLQWLLTDAMDPIEVLARLDADDVLGQMVAAAAAARLATQDPTPLERAAASGHPEVSSFASEELEGRR
jgi:hypothetical protein